MGILLELENNTWIREVRFELLSNSFDTMIVRAEVYQKDGERYIPLMDSPRYCQIEKSRNPVEYRMDLSDLYIQTNGSIYVAIVPVKISSAGTVTAKIYRNPKYHWINTATGMVYNTYRNLGIGLKVYGSELNSR